MPPSRRAEPRAAARALGRFVTVRRTLERKIIRSEQQSLDREKSQAEIASVAGGCNALRRGSSAPSPRRGRASASR